MPICPPERPAQTFVGFSDGMSLDNFELAASEAVRIVRILRELPCARAGELDPSGRLSAALRGRALYLSAVRFVRDDASMAQVELLSNTGSGYVIVATQQDDAWQLLSARVANLR